MSATTIKDALSRWERENRQSALEATEVGLQFQWLPIERMDNTLSLLTKCEILSLSTNMIEKITGLQGMKSLRILSLARNDIKSLSGLEVVAGTLEQLWMSYNLLETTKGIEGLQKLKVLYLSHNLIKFWADWSRLSELPNLVEVNFVENPLNETMEEEYWREQAINRVPQLRTLDGETVIPAHLRKAAAEAEAIKE